MINYSKLLEELIPVARGAGEAIMQVYRQDDDHRTKEDGSPVTSADKAAEKIIIHGLKEFAPQIQIISEENPDSHKLEAPEMFFLVDPLDGTKEFIKRDGKGSFTVNIALIEKGIPTMGIVYAPGLDRMFYGANDLGAFEDEMELKCIQPKQGKVVAVASVSHRDANTDAWLSDRNITNIVSIGSSLKFCLVATGQANVYPRFGPTMEWDTAAGDAILRAAGGMVFEPDGTVFTYGKDEYRNGNFIAACNSGLL